MAEIERLDGMVIRTEGPEIVIVPEEGEGTIQCITMRRKHKGGRPVVGDRVNVEMVEPGRAMIVSVYPRETVLRRAATFRRSTKVLVANIDLLVVVASANDPPLRPGLLDRYIVAAERERIRPLLCFNKWEFAEEDEIEVEEIYGALGYESLRTSAATGDGVDALTAALAGHRSAFVGHSGVGKSSLMQLVFTDVDFEVGAVNVRTGRGKHTTTHARLIDLPGGGYVVDTPGIREFGLVDVTSHTLANYYVDFADHVKACRYQPCSHTHEPDCAVKDAVDEDEVSALRYDGYLRLYDELVELEETKY